MSRAALAVLGAAAVLSLLWIALHSYRIGRRTGGPALVGGELTHPPQSPIFAWVPPEGCRLPICYEGPLPSILIAKLIDSVNPYA